jgi:RNA polymerase sigma-70 factor, ECF subfamily
MSKPSNAEDLVTLMTQFQGRLYVYILSLIGDPNAANDVLQETNIRARISRRGRSVSPIFNAWLTANDEFETRWSLATR